jgi:uncharacterized protein YdaU (DUF1376 family)
MNYYPRHLGDYARDAGHLSLAEHGAYTLLLDRYYASERPIGREEAFRICRASSKSDRDSVTRVLREFFRWTDEGYRSKRADEEIKRAREKSAKAAQSAGQRWMRTHSERNANGMLSNNQEPITNPQGASAGYFDQPKAEVGQSGTSRITTVGLIGVVGKRARG